MPRRIAYLRATSHGASVERQCAELDGAFDLTFVEPVLSSAMPVRDRPAFATLLVALGAGDELHVSSIDRLGCDAIDVARTLAVMHEMSVTVFVKGVGHLTGELARVVDLVLEQLADTKRLRPRTVQRRLARVSRGVVTFSPTHRDAESTGSGLAASRPPWR